MLKSKQEIGAEGELAAEKYLKKNRYTILQKNFRTKIGEADIICYHKPEKTLVFVEVKTRKSTAFGTPETAVTRKKQRQIIKSAIAYMKKNGIKDTTIRFDVISIITNAEHAPEINHFTNAFQADGLMI